MSKNKLPDRWLPYKPIGSRIKGTPFIAFKVPLKKTLNNKVEPKERFSPENLLSACPKLSLVIDLTNTYRYYDKSEFTSKNVYYKKILCPGHEIPPLSIVEEFFYVVDSFLKKSADPENLIGVHCTHGVNRTGYFICRYMIQRLGINPEVAIADFAEARGHPIERKNYIDHLGYNLPAIPPLKTEDVRKFDGQDSCPVRLENRRKAKSTRRTADQIKIVSGALQDQTGKIWDRERNETKMEYSNSYSGGNRSFSTQNYRRDFQGSSHDHPVPNYNLSYQTSPLDSLYTETCSSRFYSRKRFASGQDVYEHLRNERGERIHGNEGTGQESSLSNHNRPYHYSPYRIDRRYKNN